MRFALSLLILVPSLALAAPVNVRWTGADDANSDLNHVIDVLNSKTSLQLSAADFVTIEDLDMATNHFQYLAQQAAGTPIHGMSLRIWKNLASGATIQVEAQVDDSASKIVRQFQAHSGLVPSVLLGSKAVHEQAVKLVRAFIAANPDDQKIRSFNTSDMWAGGELVREFTVKASHGVYKVSVALARMAVVSQSYEHYPQGDGEYSVPAQIFQIYEETAELQRQDRIMTQLNYLHSSAIRVDSDPYTSLASQLYTDDHADPVLGMTEAGRAQGYWSMTYVKQQAAKIRNALPKTDNTFDSNGLAATNQGVILEGRYATVNINEDAAAKYGPSLNFQLGTTAQFYPTWVTNDDGSTHMVPQAALLGRPLLSTAEILSRSAERLPDHNPVKYMEDGFDEIQVYWAITTLFDQLHQRGFDDPELSTRPFNAFMYDPDISMRDNAFYTDDTINFTTYSPGAQNDARDNPTIWHELGHGVMDRLMGDMIHLADTGGLSEGMADFVAEMVVESVTQHAPFPGHEDFRIINTTGFNLTNEVHDDGEAYGGTMRDFMEAAIAAQGQDGLHKVVDLVMETMRMTRDNPALTAGGWFTHMLFADSLGRAGVRAPNEMQGYLMGALDGRNFSLDDKGLASYTLKANGKAIVPGAPGSRDHEISLNLKPTDTTTYHMSVELTDGDKYKFQYPVTVSVEFEKHALQGAVHWVGEEQDPRIFVIQKPGDVLGFDLQATGKCDSINRPDGSCSDYAYVQIINQGGTKPVAKKRFYLKIRTL